MSQLWHPMSLRRYLKLTWCNILHPPRRPAVGTWRVRDGKRQGAAREDVWGLAGKAGQRSVCNHLADRVPTRGALHVLNA